MLFRNVKKLLQIFAMFCLIFSTHSYVVKVGESCSTLVTLNDLINDPLETRDGVHQAKRFSFALPQCTVCLKSSLESINCGKFDLVVCPGEVKCRKNSVLGDTVRDVAQACLWMFSGWLWCEKNLYQQLSCQRNLGHFLGGVLNH